MSQETAAEDDGGKDRAEAEGRESLESRGMMPEFGGTVRRCRTERTSL